ncbi:MAG: methylated-DNA--[protein]-cysteine S-methyltransferase [Coriobacteriales bacterium]|nr:methylated-DNA--[protein]-cysteine S-methyltransferase [Coriobacteriales bacterium]
MMYYSALFKTQVGDLTFASDGQSLTGLWIDNQKYHGGSTLEGAKKNDDLEIFDAARNWITRYFAGARPTPLELSLAPQGSAFRQDVWDILCQIPYGEVLTYGAIARQMAKRMGKAKMSAQAVGGAVGHNPISIIIPCHRVIGSNGSLTGYAGGIGRKVQLLEWENVNMIDMFIPTKGTAL